MPLDPPVSDLPNHNHENPIPQAAQPGRRSAGASGRAPGRWGARVRRAIAIVLLVWLVSGVWHTLKPLPAGLSVTAPLRPATSVALLRDVTWTDPQGNRAVDQQVFDEVLRLIAQARRAVVLDMFLFNDFGGMPNTGMRPLSDELTDALIARKRALPTLTVVVITDPINTVYGALRSPTLDALREAGIHVVITDLARLRTPNPIWSGLWQLCCRWTGNRTGAGWLPNPFGEGKITLRSYLALLNLNANHRKTLVVDEGASWTGLVTSANPHDASSAHGNSAIRFSGAAALDLLRTERAVMEMSGQPLPNTLIAVLDAAADELPIEAPDAHAVQPAVELQVLTEAAIRDALLAAVDATEAGDRLDIAVFYFSHRPLLAGVIGAHRRGAVVRVLLDPNRDAFGRTKNGIPNRQVALDLHRAGVPVRWCDTRGEQCHSKLLLVRRQSGAAELILGSSNFTRRNLDDYNLETDIRALATKDSPVMTDAVEYFEQSWHNRDGRQLSLPYPAYADDSWLRYWRYRLAEATGLSSF